MICEFCECGHWLYLENLPTGRLKLPFEIGIDKDNKELYATIYNCEDIVENVRIDIKYCPMCGKDLHERILYGR